MRAVLLPLLTSLLFSGSYIAGKYTTLDLGPLTTSLLRYLVALLFLGCLVLMSRGTVLRIERSDLPKLLLLGLFGIVGYHYFFFLSLRYTAVANTAIINALSPVLTGLLAALFTGERLPRTSYVGILAACLGVLVLLTRGKPLSLLSVEYAPGDLLMLCSVLCWAVYALLVKSLSDKYTSLTLTFYAVLFGVLMLAALALVEEPAQQIRNMSGASIYAVTYMGVAASGLGYLLYNMSIRAIGPTRTSSFVYSTVPIFVSVLALAAFSESITVVMLLSVALILWGLQRMLKS